MRWLVALLTLLPGLAEAAACKSVIFEEIPYSVCEAGPGDDLRLFHSGPDGAYGGFSAVNAALAAQGQKLLFAMNAGMFQPDLSPVGLYIEDGVEKSPLITAKGPGNFGMLPNGVFCAGDGFAIYESRRYEKLHPTCRYASQSGPMLVIKGDLHPRFLVDSDSRNIRNGVGVSADGKRAVFVISNRPVNFYDFARFFRDGLGLPDALYFDGSISRMYAPDLGRSGAGFSIGPMVGVVVPRG
jgi:uncharacterized protein YigE (DUF2233 family)